MKKLDCATVTPEEIRALKGLYPTAETYFLVAVWNMGKQRWTIRQTQWMSAERADQEGRNLPPPYTHYVVLPINLPGVAVTNG